MYLDSKDYQTIWQLAHNCVDADPDKSDPQALSDEVKIAIHRFMGAAFNRAITIRTRRMVFFEDESFLSFIFDFHHFKKFRKCLRRDEFNKAYLDSIYLKRADVLRWCQNEFLPPPPIWQIEEAKPAPVQPNESTEDDEETGWYEGLTDKRKKRVACLEMAKILWSINPKLTYEQIYRHPAMQQYGNPRVFTLKSFKNWARPFAPEAVKIGGKPKETSKYEDLIRR